MRKKKKEIKKTVMKLKKIKERDIITEEKNFVNKSDAFEIIKFLEAKYSKYASLPTPEAIKKVCDEYKKLYYSIHKKEAVKNEQSSNGTKRIKRGILLRHKRPGINNTTKTRKVSDKKRCLL